MSTIFLHVGMHKTGSTAIQSAFNNFDDGKTVYADLGYENHSIPFYTAFSEHYRNYHIWLSAGLSPAEIDQRRNDSRRRIENVVKKTKGRNVIFSGEDMSFLSRKSLLEVGELFKQNAWTVKVIVYVRHPTSFILSWFQEAIKNGMSIDGAPPPRFQDQIEKFIDLFSKDNLEIHLYDYNSLYNNDIVSDFARIIRVNSPEKIVTNNKSLSSEAVKVLYILNKIFPPAGESKAYQAARRQLIENLRISLPGSFKVPSHLFFGLIDDDDVDWLYSVSGIDFRMRSVESPPFSSSALSTFLSTLDDATTEVLRSHLSTNCGISSPPSDQNFLVARYFMSFMESNATKDFNFDPDLYLTLNPDVKKAGVDPYRHYLEYGLREGRRLK